MQQHDICIGKEGLPILTPCPASFVGLLAYFCSKFLFLLNNRGEDHQETDKILSENIKKDPIFCIYELVFPNCY